ncbi:MAG: antibiotic biosynthesis monooxygenase [Oscillospiraceae bacterium]|nr:antibiotic biosynthesis monooxygenase [Oscillospiraceae bacterium]
MQNHFSEIKLFQVKPDKLDDFEALTAGMAEAQKQQPGCIGVKYVKRFYTIDGVESGHPPRELTKIVKCVKYFSCWDFDTIEHYGKAVEWFFAAYGKQVQKLLIMPFDIHCGYSVY